MSKGQNIEAKVRGKCQRASHVSLFVSLHSPLFLLFVAFPHPDSHMFPTCFSNECRLGFQDFPTVTQGQAYLNGKPIGEPNRIDRKQRLNYTELGTLANKQF